MKIGVLSFKKKLAFIKVEKEGTYIWIWLEFSLYSLTKLARQKEEEQKNDSVTDRKRSDAPVTFTK